MALANTDFLELEYSGIAIGDQRSNGGIAIRLLSTLQDNQPPNFDAAVG